MEWSDISKHIFEAITSIAVLIIGIIIARRKEAMDKIEKKIDSLRDLVDEGKKECSTDIRAVLAGQAAFQYEVARDYPSKNDIGELKQELRDEIRSLRQEYHQSDPSRRGR